MTFWIGLLFGIGLGLLAGAGVALLGRLPNPVRLELERDERALFEAQHDGLLVVDAFGRVVRANRAALVICGRESLDDELLVELLPDYDVEGDAVMRTSGAGALVGMVRPQSLETPMGAVSIEIHAAPLSGGRTLFVLREPAKQTDDEDGLQQRLRKARRELAQKDRFLASLSHELRTPMNAVLGYADLLAEDLSDQPERLEDVHRIQRVGRHLGEVIDGVLDLAKMGAGQVVLKPETIAVPALVRELADTVRPLVKASGSELVVEIRYEGTIEADPFRLRQVLLNLLGNAAKFTEQGTVTFSVSQGQDGVVAFAVRDTGVGIAPDQQELVFGEFTQTRNATTDSGAPRGTGLGLAISRRLARLMQGEIVLTSVVGEGSTFTLRLPTGLFSGV